MKKKSAINVFFHLFRKRKKRLKCSEEHEDKQKLERHLPVLREL